MENKVELRIREKYSTNVDGILIIDCSFAENNPGMANHIILNGKYVWLGTYGLTIPIPKGTEIYNDNLNAVVFVPYKKRELPSNP